MPKFHIKKYYQKSMEKEILLEDDFIECSGKWDAIRSMTDRPNDMNWQPHIICDLPNTIDVEDDGYRLVANYVC